MNHMAAIPPLDYSPSVFSAGGLIKDRLALSGERT